jgi:5-hydroxyisourate hydrolase
MMGKLSTHVLDTMHGSPAAGVAIELYAMNEATPSLMLKTITNADGRTDAPLLNDAEVKRGKYRLVFHAGDYFRARGTALPEPSFVDVVTIDFGIAEDGGSYHVPLVCSPWTYSTYRGS